MGDVLEGVFGSPPQCGSVPGQNDRGEGGALYSGKTQNGFGASGVSSSKSESVNDSAVPGREERRADLADVLLSLGVYVLSTAKRQATAAALLAAGVTEEQVRDIAAFISESEPEGPTQRKYLVAILANPDRAKDAANGTASFRLAQSGRLPVYDIGHGFEKHHQNVPAPWVSCRCKTCDAMRSAGLKNWTPQGRQS